MEGKFGDLEQEMATIKNGFDKLNGTMSKEIHQALESVDKKAQGNDQRLNRLETLGEFILAG